MEVPGLPGVPGALSDPRIAPLSRIAAGSGSAQANRPSAEQQEIERVSGEFAALLVQQLVKEMFETVKEGEGPFGSGPGSDIQRSMAETAFSQALTERGLDSLRDAIARAVDPGERLTAEEITQQAAAADSNLARETEKKR